MIEIIAAGKRWALFHGRGLGERKQGWCPRLRQEPTPHIPLAVFGSKAEPPTSLSPEPHPSKTSALMSWPSQVTPQHDVDFANPCGEGRPLWVRETPAYPLASGERAKHEAQPGMQSLRPSLSEPATSSPSPAAARAGQIQQSHCAANGHREACDGAGDRLSWPRMRGDGGQRERRPPELNCS